MWTIFHCRKSLRNTLVILFSFLLVLACNWTLPDRLPDIIKHDTILTLSVFHAWLLFLLAFCVTLFCAWVSVLKTCYLQQCCVTMHSNSGEGWFFAAGALGDFLLTIAAYWLALTLVPQFFYLFYRMIIPGLPLQWVVKPLEVGLLWRLLQIEQLTILSDLSAGLLLSTLLTALIWSWLLVFSSITTK